MDAVRPVNLFPLHIPSALRSCALVCFRIVPTGPAPPRTASCQADAMQQQQQRASDSGSPFVYGMTFFNLPLGLPLETPVLALLPRLSGHLSSF